MRVLICDPDSRIVSAVRCPEVECHRQRPSDRGGFDVQLSKPLEPSALSAALG